MEIKPNLYIGGKYSRYPIRHRNSNPETHEDYFSANDFNILSDPMEADIFLAIDHSENESAILQARLRAKKLNVLFRSEPKCVIPSAYKAKTQKLYSSILSFGYPLGSNQGELWPQFWPETDSLILTNEFRKERAVIVNANKLSLNRSEMYTFRRKCLAKLSFIDLFGAGWNTSKSGRFLTMLREVKNSSIQNIAFLPLHARFWFKNWKETTSPLDKSIVLASYKYSLVIENDLSYMSEKLFDAMFAGCLPIYVGPDVARYGIPNHLVIQATPSIKGISEAFQLAESLDYAEYAKDLFAWLSEEDVINTYSGEAVFRRSSDFLINTFATFDASRHL